MQPKLSERVERLERERDAAIMQARGWKMEAMGQRATVHEIYRSITGGTGEPGDWNGAVPVIRALKARGL